MSQATLLPILPSETPPKKPWLLGCSIVAVLLSGGFFAGRGYQHIKNGYNFKIHEEKSYPFSEGTIHLKHASETVGWAFMDTGKTVIEFTSTSHPHITLYKAQRGFQESTPLAKNLTVDGNTLRWDDGEFKYTLKMEAMPPEKPTASAEAKTSVTTQ